MYLFFLNSILWQNNSNTFVKCIIYYFGKMGKSGCFSLGQTVSLRGLAARLGYIRVTGHGPRPVTGHSHVTVATWPDDPGACISLGVKPTQEIPTDLSLWQVLHGVGGWVVCVSWSLRQECPLLGAIGCWMDADWSQGNTQLLAQVWLVVDDDQPSFDKLCTDLFTSVVVLVLILTLHDKARVNTYRPMLLTHTGPCC